MKELMLGDMWGDSLGKPFEIWTWKLLWEEDRGSCGLRCPWAGMKYRREWRCGGLQMESIAVGLVALL